VLYDTVISSPGIILFNVTKHILPPSFGINLQLGRQL